MPLIISANMKNKIRLTEEREKRRSASFFFIEGSPFQSAVISLLQKMKYIQKAALKRRLFVLHGELLRIAHAVLLCLNKYGAAIGVQYPVGVAHLKSDDVFINPEHTKNT